jgi:putative membrane protein
MSYLNDPRVLFATERTLLAWNRTAIGLMSFGFLVERFGLFLHVVLGHPEASLHQQASLIIGVAFILLGVVLLVLSVRQYRLVIRALGSDEIPTGYWINSGVLTNIVMALLGLLLAAYLILL